MATLSFNYGVMGAGKSTLALQIAHSLSTRGWEGLLCTQSDRTGEARVSSRMGAAKEAILYTPETDFLQVHTPHMKYLVVDECQFLTPNQVEQLGYLVDKHDVEVHCFGLLTDFRSRMFPGSARLMELSDHRAPLPVDVVCSCGRPGVVNARLIDGEVQTEGATKVVGDTATDSSVRYEVLCRLHYFENIRPT